MRKIAALPAEKDRERKKRIGTIGSAARSSRAMNATSSSRPAVSAPMISRLPQPAEFPRTSPQTIAKAAPLISARPGRSRLVSLPKLSSSRLSTNGIAARAIGTLSQKIHCQSMPSAIAPPTSGPIATAIPVTALNRPIAAPRFSGGKAALRSARPSVITRAAPAPWTARAAIRKPTLGARALAADAAANRPNPIA